MTVLRALGLIYALFVLAGAAPLGAQTAPDDADVAAYKGLHAAVASQNHDEIKKLIAAGADRESGGTSVRL